MAKKNYEEASKKIIEAVGGKDNITYFAHCFTRLRFNLKDKNLVDAEALGKVAIVIGSQWTGDQLQLIIGQEVEDVYNSICKVAGIQATAAVDEKIDESNKKKDFSIKNLFNQMVAAITACIGPVLVVFSVGGFMRLFVALLGPATFNLLPADHNLLVVFRMIGDACFQFMPMFVAYSAAIRFGANVPLALMLSGILVSPALVEIVNLGEPFTVYGIPVILTSYTASFLPSLLTTWVLSKVEKFFKNLFPRAIRGILYPLCTILVMLPLMLCVLGPIGTIAGQLIAGFILWIRNIFGPVATGLVGALFPLLIVTGMHHTLNAAATVEYLKNGFDSVVYAGSYFMDFQLMSLCFASLIKSKKPENKAYALSCIATEGLGGVSEPTIFGIMLKSKRNILYVLIGGFAAGFYVGLMGVNCYVLAPGGFLSVLAYSGGTPMNFVHGVIACVIAFAIPFTLALIFGLGIENDEEVISNEKAVNTK